MGSYADFLRSKVVIAPESGFDVERSEVNPALKPHQQDAVIWGCKGGRRALFESFGLGKTAQELEFCRLCVKHNGGKALIVLPLGVRQEFTRDAMELLGWQTAPQYVRTMAEAAAATTDILLTNYERVRDGDMDRRPSPPAPWMRLPCCGASEAKPIRPSWTSSGASALSWWRRLRRPRTSTRS